ncbi:App1 family protein [Minwuia thermotolerans]|uniref:Phosphatidate phosphatase APP1 catalytic domain-containing protein n=1 Tax=Minwuia thermotolerans TaxID=2056226 RepID=A0A2M9FVX8_9PROT|nr:phosphatase domain-containing protein [Minwuia thermotolerans]PJK27628.1 hypothetical protein CVT23_22225 [Minwuia thermotolerans]
MSALRRLIRRLARPARTSGGRGGPVIQAWRGCGNGGEVMVLGRVLRQPPFGLGERSDPASRDLVDVLRRFLRRGYRHAELEARFAGATVRVTADRSGFFAVRLKPARPLPRDGMWHAMKLTLNHRGETVEDEAHVFVPPPAARHLVISDIDDTVMFTGVGNTLAMLWRLFVAGAESRTAFPGVAAFYQALHRGPSGEERNPMVYVSRGPWSLYEVLETFFRLHRIPEGPVLFLRDWGLTLQRPLPRRAVDHKRGLIEAMLAIYPDYRVVLIGDSGQHDPEIYARIVRDHPGRVAAVYIRDVTRPKRDRAVEELARRLDADGHSPLVLADDSFEMARHAAGLGLISEADLQDVLAEKAAEGGMKPAPAAAD